MQDWEVTRRNFQAKQASRGRCCASDQQAIGKSTQETGMWTASETAHLAQLAIPTQLHHLHATPFLAGQPLI